MIIQFIEPDLSHKKFSATLAQNLPLALMEFLLLEKKTFLVLQSCLKILQTNTNDNYMLTKAMAIGTIAS